MGPYATVVESIDAYTGLSPAAFFTIAALMVGAYLLVSACFFHPDAAAADKRSALPTAGAEQASPPPFLFAEPVQIGDITLDELRAYDGSDPKKPLLVAIKGQIFDVSRGRRFQMELAHRLKNKRLVVCIRYYKRLFYGPGGPYSLFAGRDATRALALMSFDPNDLTGNIEGLSEDELEVLQDWEEKFKEKYVKVGQLVTERNKDSDCRQSSEKMEETQESQQGSKDQPNSENRGVTWELH